MFGHCLEGVNKKSFALSVIVMLVFIWVTDFVIHGVLLKGLYEETASLWRTPDEMNAHMIWMLIGKILIAKYFVFIFVKGREGKGIAEGVRYGLLMALFAAGPCFIHYAVTPMPMNLLWAWVGGAVAQYMIGGAIIAKIYKPAA